jgi:hypothetical protein
MTKYTGDIRRDFDKATAEISKLNETVLIPKRSLGD